jgi:hypothetical protein
MCLKLTTSAKMMTIGMFTEISRKMVCLKKRRRNKVS